MPSGIEQNRGGSSLRQRAAKHSRDKAVEAQRKNKLESAQLQLFHSLLDKNKVRATVMLNREKDDVRSKMKQMRKTTGLYKGALAPDGPSDKDHEKSPYFQTLGHVSEKRLQKWKNEERALQRVKLSEEGLRPPWEKDSKEVAEETLGHLLNMLGYDEKETKEVLGGLRQDRPSDLNPDDAPGDGDEGNNETPAPRSGPQPAKLGSASLSSFSGTSSYSERAERVDVFECLKDEEKNGNSRQGSRGRQGLSTGAFDSSSADDIFYDSLSGKNKSKFSVRAWEKSMIEQYKNKLINPTVYSNKNSSRKIRAFKDRPKSAPAQTGPALKTGCLLSKRKQKGHLRYLEAGSQKMESINGSEKNAEEGYKSISVSDKEMVNAGSASRGNLSRSLRPMSVLPPRAVEVTKGLMADKRSRPKTALRKVPSRDSHHDHVLLSSSQKALPGDQRLNSVAVSETDFESGEKNHSVCADPRGVCPSREENIEQEKKPALCVIKENAGRTTPSSGEKRTYPATIEVKSYEPLLENARPANALPNHQNSPEAIQNKKQFHFPRSQSVPGPASFPPADNVVPNKLANRCRSLSVNDPESNVVTGRKFVDNRRHELPDAADLSDEYVDVDDERTGVFSDIRPQWRRRLLAEAPPGLGRPTDQKVRLAVSKSQLRRDMEKMIVDHESDMKEQIRKERMRRMRKRMDIILTLQKLVKKPPREEGTSENDLPEVKEPPTENSRLKTKALSIMHMLRMSKNFQSPSEKVKAKVTGSENCCE